jgi:RNA polymerase sigma factor (sigma-70 family)
MSSLDSSFAERFARLCAGEKDRDTDFLNHYVKRLLGLARSRLHAKTQVRVDAEDVVQSAMLSFAIRHRGEVDLQAEDGLWAKLVEITLRHCNKWNKRVRRERLKTVPIQPSRDEADTGFEPEDDEPTPEEAAVLADLVEWLMRGLETVRQREVLKLLLQGYTPSEVSRELKMAVRTVFRTRDAVRGRIRQRLEELTAAE